MSDRNVTIIGGGLAGCEAAWQAAERGIGVRLFEMRPSVRTPAHQTDRLAELVCSNSLKSESLEDASGLLKQEMRALGSLILPIAEANRVPAGSALAVDRVAFAAAITRAIEGHPMIELIREEVGTLPEARPLIVASGPLTSERLTADLMERFSAFLEPPTGSRSTGRLLYFYDAISPIVSADSINREIAFAAARYEVGGADYLNCPFTREEYQRFREALLHGERYPLHDFERPKYFEGCLPVEELAERGEDTLRFGPMRPVGIRDPRTGQRPFAVVQLRQENRGPDGQPTMFNLVGFQTRLRRVGQAEGLRLIPGLEQAEILRYGSIHRNTFLTAPLLLERTLQFRGDPGILFAGQLTGVEGYLESAATGLLAGINAARLLIGKPPVYPPSSTVLGGLLNYLFTATPAAFQPINANFGLLPALSQVVRNRRERNHYLAARAQADFQAWRQAVEEIGEQILHPSPTPQSES
jgi:methylenetetrahydrofolate--tRNA-(uracil-5-)-methyltransferase